MGTSKDTAENELTASPRRIWIHIGRCKQATTEEQVVSYLGKKCPGEKFDVMKLESKGRNAAFRIGAPQNLRDKVYEASFWPESITVKRFFFRRTAEVI